MKESTLMVTGVETRASDRKTEALRVPSLPAPGPSLCAAWEPEQLVQRGRRRPC